MERSKTTPPKTRSASFAPPWAFPLVGALLSFLIFQALGSIYFGGFKTSAGSIRLPVPDHLYCVALWTLFGGAAAVFLWVAFCRVSNGAIVTRMVAGIDRGTDRAWTWAVTLAALAIAVALRRWILHGMPLTDDETCYTFMARLLASGRLKAVSPLAKLFHDRVFMINDGSFYPQYFVGWPLVMAPFTWLGLQDYANAVCSAATVPALFAILREVAGRRWARFGLLLYLASPFLMIGAATQLSHTSALLALAWMIALFLRIRSGRSSLAGHAAFFAVFCLAFWIRPTSAVGIALPFLFAWLATLRSMSPSRRLVTFATAALVSLIGASIFLAVNAAQTGSPFLAAYQRYIAYSIENGCRFSLFPTVEAAERMRVINMEFTGLFKPLSMLGTALFRMNIDLWGWPCSLLFAAMALGAPGSGLFVLSLLSFVATHFFISDVGVDLYGPIHYTETALPLLVLTVIGLRRATDGCRHGMISGTAMQPARFPALAALALTLVALMGYIPIRLGTLANVTAHIARPFRTVEAARLSNAIVFAPLPFAPWTEGRLRHFVFNRPVNDPDLKNNVWWVNHISIDDDRRFMSLHPDRTGYVLFWDKSHALQLVPLDGLSSDAVAPPPMGGTGEPPDWDAINAAIPTHEHRP